MRSIGGPTRPGRQQAGGPQGPTEVRHLPPDPRPDLLAARIRSELETHLGLLKLPNSFGTSQIPSKDAIRRMHELHRGEVLQKARGLLESHGEELEEALAPGSEVDPPAISPFIVPVGPETPESRLFRLASLTWSVPVSNGYGRRMRFLVKDRQNRKLIGLIALTDPVFNLGARDDWVGWTAADRTDRLRFVMDACVLGALPPYSYLIGGKLVAALAASSEIRESFRRRYRRSKSEISHRRNNIELALLTTTSALGKSSIYDRLKVMRKVEFLAVGETKGYGHFHVPDSLFQIMRQYLAMLGHAYANGNRFGQGPNWKMRVIRETIRLAGSDPEILHHGIPREVYVVPLAHNAKRFLAGEADSLRPISASASVISSFCKGRWMIPRASRDERYRDFKPESLVHELKRAARVV